MFYQEFGRTDIGLQVLLQQDFPSIANWINQGSPEQRIGATTLWETWGNNATGPCTGCPDSYNHIMWGTYGAWLYSDVAGLGRVSGPTRGWKNLILKPAAFVHPEVTFASASVDTPIGLASVYWHSEPKVSNWYGKASQGTPDVSGVTLVCRSVEDHHSARFTGVSFAAFGSPTGDTPTTFKRTDSCDHPNATAVVSLYCIGKHSCTIPLSTDTFGKDSTIGTGSKWCPKPLGPLTLAVAMEHNGCDAQVLLTTKGTVPVGGRATFVLPIGPRANTSSVAVTEGPSDTTVFTHGRFIAGAASGIANASIDNGDGHVHIETGSGTYFFSVLT